VIGGIRLLAVTRGHPEELCSRCRPSPASRHPLAAGQAHGASQRASVVSGPHRYTSARRAPMALACRCAACTRVPWSSSGFLLRLIAGSSGAIRLSPTAGTRRCGGPDLLLDVGMTGLIREARRSLCRGRHDPGCSTRAFAAPDRRVIESQPVRLSANSLRPERRSTDGQVILKRTSGRSESRPDLLFCGAPLRNRTADLLLAMDHQTVPVSAAEALSRPNASSR
jgi:hypothetical protein